VATLRELVTKIKYDVDTNGLHRAEKMLGKMGQQMRGVNPATGGLTGAVENVVGGFNKIRMGWAATVAALGGTAYAFGAFTKSVLTSAGAMEQSEIAFATMLKSTEKAKKLIGDIQSFAIKTPFEQEQLIQAARTLLGFGTAAEDIIPTLTRLGDMAAGVGVEKLPIITKAFGKMQVKGRVTMEELNMLLENGVPMLKALANQFGVTEEAIYKMIEQGKVRFADVNKAITALTTGSGIYTNMMINQSKSLFGVFSNISDYFQVLGTQIGTAVLPTVKELAQEFLKWVEANREWIKTEAVDFMIMFADGAKGLLKAYKALTPYVKAVTGYLGGFAGFLKEIWKISPVNQALMMANAFARIATSLGFVGKEGSFLGKVFDGALWGLKKFGKAISIIVRLPALLLDDFAGFLEGKDSMTGRLLGFFVKLADNISNVFKQALFTPVQLIRDVIAWLNQEIGNMLGMADGLIGSLPFGDSIREGWNAFAGMFNNPFLPGVGQALTVNPFQAGIGPSTQMAAQTAGAPMQQQVSITHNNTINANGLSKEAAEQVFFDSLKKKTKEDLQFMGDMAGKKIVE
jgi:tape measure domain-containing protein